MKYFYTGFSVAFFSFLTLTSFGLSNPGMIQYYDALNTYHNMQIRVNYATGLISKQGEKAFKDIKKHNQSSAVSIIIISPETGKILVAPKHVSLTEGELNFRNENTKLFARQIVKDTVEMLDSSTWDNLMNVLNPIELKNHFAKLAITPEGKTYIVTTGTKNIVMAKVFIHHVVDSACSLMKEKGIKAAFKTFNEKGSPYRNNNTYIYVITDKGKYLVNPNYPSIVGKNMYDYPGCKNNYPVRKMIKALSSFDSAWLFTESIKPENTVTQEKRIEMDQEGKELNKKISYIKKVTIDNKTYIVGSGAYLE